MVCVCGWWRWWCVGVGVGVGGWGGGGGGGHGTGGGGMARGREGGEAQRRRRGACVHAAGRQWRMRFMGRAPVCSGGIRRWQQARRGAPRAPTPRPQTHSQFSPAESRAVPEQGRPRRPAAAGRERKGEGSHRLLPCANTGGRRRRMRQQQARRGTHRAQGFHTQLDPVHHRASSRRRGTPARSRQ